MKTAQVTDPKALIESSKVKSETLPSFPEQEGSTKEEQTIVDEAQGNKMSRAKLDSAECDDKGKAPDTSVVEESDAQDPINTIQVMVGRVVTLMDGIKGPVKIEAVLPAPQPLVDFADDNVDTSGNLPNDTSADNVVG